MDEERPRPLAAFFAAFAAAQLELDNPSKNTRGQARGNRNYKYADLASVVGVLTEVLGDHGLCFMQAVVREGTTVSLRTTVGHAEGHSMDWYYPFPNWPNGPQDQGSLITYARRYQLMSIFGLAPEDDDGSGAQRAAEKRRQRERAVPPAEVAQNLKQHRQARQPLPDGTAGRIERRQPTANPPQKARQPYSPQEWTSKALPLQPDEVAWHALLTKGAHPEQMDALQRAEAFAWCSRNADRVKADLGAERLKHQRQLRAKLGGVFVVLKKGDGARDEDIAASKAANEKAYKVFLTAAYGVGHHKDIAPWRIYGDGRMPGTKAWLNGIGEKFGPYVLGLLKRFKEAPPERRTQIAEQVIDADEKRGWVVPCS